MLPQMESNSADSNPPFETTYKTLFEISETITESLEIEECDLPLIDLSCLNDDDEIERERCMKEIARASSECGFFQVLNHGISHELLRKVRCEQIKAFQQPFEKKAKGILLNFPANSYRWGTPTATSLKQLSWSEAYHIPLTEISNSGKMNSFRETIEEFAEAVSSLAQRLAEVLAENLDSKTSYFAENCTTKSSYLRLNRYPPCPISNSEVFGIVPHTDSDFLTIVHQDQVGGLQLMKDGRWVAVKPNPAGEKVRISRRLVAIFLMMTMADFSDQWFGWQDQLFDNSNGRMEFTGNDFTAIWPGNGKPGLWVSSVSRMGALYNLIVREEEIYMNQKKEISNGYCVNGGIIDRNEEIELVIPPVFENCTRVLDPRDQISARDCYWEVVTNGGKLGFEKVEELLMKTIDKNPFVGEPHVMLGQVYLTEKRFEEGEREAEMGLKLILEWGSTWDKRMSWEGWIAWARVLVMKAKERSWPQTSWGILNLGLVK